MDTENEGPPVAPQLGRGEVFVELSALLGRGTRYIGKLDFDGRVRIEGSFEGEIRGKDVLVIGDGADVKADIEVGVCIVTGGNVQGNIRARDAIELHAPAVVQGDLHAPNVFIDRGVKFRGACRMEPLEGEPVDEEIEALQAATAAGPEHAAAGSEHATPQPKPLDSSLAHLPNSSDEESPSPSNEALGEPEA